MSSELIKAGEKDKPGDPPIIISLPEPRATQLQSESALINAPTSPVPQSVPTNIPSPTASPETASKTADCQDPTTKFQPQISTATANETQDCDNPVDQAPEVTVPQTTHQESTDLSIEPKDSEASSAGSPTVASLLDSITTTIDATTDIERSEAAQLEPDQSMQEETFSEQVNSNSIDPVATSKESDQKDCPAVNGIEGDDIEEITVEEDKDCDEEYVVEKIIDQKVDSDGRARYLVKWEGYPMSSNTWEPLENLVECDKAMKAYELARAQKLAQKITKKVALSDESLEEELKRTKDQNEYKVEDIIGITKIEEEKFFLIKLKDCGEKTFIRASLANKIFPDKVIDFYIKHIQWKQKSD